MTTLVLVASARDIMTENSPRSVAKVIPFKRAQGQNAGKTGVEVMGEQPLKIRIGHPEPDVWDLPLTTLFVDRLDLDPCIAILRKRRITRVVHLDNKEVAHVFDGAGLTLRQTREFIGRLQAAAGASLVRSRA